MTDHTAKEKADLLSRRCQYIVTDAHGIVKSSCDSLFSLPAGSSILTAKEPPLSSLKLKSSTTILDGRYVVEVTDLSENERSIWIIELAQDPARDLKRKSKLLVEWMTSNIFRHRDEYDQPAYKLVQSCLAEIINQEKSPPKKIPFKIDHVVGAIHLCLMDKLTSQRITLDCRVLFGSKFVIGDRSGLLTILMDSFYKLIEQSPDSSLVIEFAYSPDSMKLTLSIKGGFPERVADLMPEVVTDGSVLSFEIPLTVVGYVQLVSDKARLTPEQFPYLFDITGGDNLLVIELLQTIVEQVSTDIDLLESAFQSQKWEDLERLPHKLKPNFTSIERRDLSDALHEMESFAIKRDLKGFQERLTAFLPQARSIVAQLHSFT